MTRVTRGQGGGWPTQPGFGWVGFLWRRRVARPTRFWLGGVFVALMLVAASGALSAQTTLTVAAAANMQPALREIAAQYEKRGAAKVTLVFGSSGNLATQIEHGAPYDVFLSADMEQPQRLVSQGAALPESLAVYAIGKLVLLASRESVAKVAEQGARALLDPSVRKIAIANPQHAPYGKAALAFLRNAGLYEQVSAKLVLGEDVVQAAQFVSSGNADAGLIPLSLALAASMKEKGGYRELAADLYPPIRQGVVVVKRSKNLAAAAQFVAYLSSAEAAAVLRRNGYELPPGERR